MQLRVAGRASPWLATLVAGGTAAVCAVALHCAPRGRTCAPPTPGGGGPAHAIHVELAPGATLPGSRPLFTHLPPGVADDRARWRLVDAMSPDDALASVVEHLAA